MCVENVFYDEYPDGKLVEFRRLEICQYGQPSRPCFNLTILENPPRYIRYGELTTQAMLSQPAHLPPRGPHTPPRSPHRRSGSDHRNSGEYTSDEGRRPRRNSGLAALLNGKKLRQHRKERIVIVESPPTPRTPPMRSGQFPQVLTAPSSPSTPPYVVDSPIGRGRPIIVDERPLRRERAPSVSAVVGERLPTVRARSQSFSERVGRRLEEEDREDREREERRRRRKERDAREAERDVERRLAERIALQNEEILRRPAVPMPPRRLSEREYLRPVIDQSGVLQNAMGNLTLDDRTAELATERRRREEREALIRARMTAERLAEEEEALKQRLKERQQPNRRFSVGPGHRRHRVLYDDGVYRWE